MKSNFLSLGMKDLIRSVIVASGTAALTVLIPVLQGGGVPTPENYRVAGLSAIAAGLSYLLKNLFTNSKDQLAKPEPDGNKK